MQFVKAMSIVGSIHGYYLGQLSFLFMLKEEARCLKEEKEHYQKFLAKDNLPQVYIPTNEISHILGLKVKWQNVVKDIAYFNLDLRIRH